MVLLSTRLTEVRAFRCGWRAGWLVGDRRGGGTVGPWLAGWLAACRHSRLHTCGATPRTQQPPTPPLALAHKFAARNRKQGTLMSCACIAKAPCTPLSPPLHKAAASVLHLPCSDFYSEFQQALSQSPLFPPNTKMLVLW